MLVTARAAGQASFSRTSWLTAEPSARPATCGITSAITRPEVAQARRADLGDRVVDDLLELVLGERLGHELLEHLELGLLRSACSSRPPSRNASRRLDPPLALALQHLELLVVLQRPLQLLLGRPQGWTGSGAARRARTSSRSRIASLQLVLDLGDQAHPGSPPVPPRMCQCRWKTVWPAPGADVDDHTVVVEPAPARGLGDELEHPLRLVGRKLADLPERLDVPLGDDEQVRPAFGLMSSIATKPVGAVTNVVGSSPATSRQKRQSGQAARIPSSVTAPPRTRTSSPTGASTSHGE